MWREVKVIERVTGKLKDIHGTHQRPLGSHPFVQEGQGERHWRGVYALGVPGLVGLFHITPSPEVFIAHLLCLVQMIDRAGLFVLLFFM